MADGFVSYKKTQKIIAKKKNTSKIDRARRKRIYLFGRAIAKKKGVIDSLYLYVYLDLYTIISII